MVGMKYTNVSFRCLKGRSWLMSGFPTNCLRYPHMEMFPNSPVAAVRDTYKRRSFFVRIKRKSMAIPTHFTAIFLTTIRPYCSRPPKNQEISKATAIRVMDSAP